MQQCTERGQEVTIMQDISRIGANHKQDLAEPVTTVVDMDTWSGIVWLKINSVLVVESKAILSETAQQDVNGEVDRHRGDGQIKKKEMTAILEIHQEECPSKEI